MKYTRLRNNTNKWTKASRRDLDEEINFAFTPNRNISYTVTTREKLSELQEIYSSVEIEILQSVLEAADYRIDYAAEMLSEMARDELSCPTQDNESIIDDIVMVNYPHDGNDVESSQNWIVVQDDWELVDDFNNQVTIGKKPVRSFAEVAKLSIAQNANALNVQPRLPILTPQQTILKHKKNTINPKQFDQEKEDLNILSVKSFGTRKRHHIRRR